MKLPKKLTVATRTTLAVGLVVGGLVLSTSSPAMAKGNKEINGSITGKCTFNDYADPNYKTEDASTSGTVSADQNGHATQSLARAYVGNVANDRMTSFSVQCDLTRGSVVSIETGTSYSCVGQLTKGRVELFRDSNMNTQITPAYVAFTDFSFQKLSGDNTRGQCKSHINFGKPNLPPDQNDTASSWSFNLEPR